jgi:hypothetical protein
MAIVDTSAVSDDAKNLASMLQGVLDRVITAYDSFNMPLPGRRYYTFGTPSVECEQIVVSFIQMYLGTPGDEATTPRRCHDPRSATLNISVSRAVPTTQQNGQAPHADDIQEANRVAALDAWVLMESVNLLDTWGDDGFPGLGVIATVDGSQPEGGFTTTSMTITMAIP